MKEQRPFTGIVRSVAAFDMLLFPLFVQVGSRGHTNSHGHPLFNFFRGYACNDGAGGVRGLQTHPREMRHDACS
jgi:hypothetical protein